MCLSFAGFEVVISAHGDFLGDCLHQLFHHLAGGEPQGREPLRHLHLRETTDGYFELTEHEHKRESGPLDYVLHFTRRWIINAFIEACPHLLWFHASGVADRRQAVLLVGPSGAGKSTLSTRLVQRGWCYLSDDILPVDPQGVCAMPFPYTPTVRDFSGAGGPLSPNYLEQAKAVVEVPPERICRAPMPIGGLVFLAYAPGDPVRARMDKMAPTAAVRWLIKQCAFPPERESQTIANIIKLTREAACRQMLYCDSDQAVERIVELAGGLAA